MQSASALTVWVPLDSMAFFTLVYCSEFYPPTSRELYLVGGGWVVVFLVDFLGGKRSIFFSFFSDVLSYEGTIIFFQYLKSLVYKTGPISS